MRTHPTCVSYVYWFFSIITPFIHIIPLLCGTSMPIIYDTYCNSPTYLKRDKYPKINGEAPIFNILHEQGSKICTSNCSSHQYNWIRMESTVPDREGLMYMSVHSIDQKRTIAHTCASIGKCSNLEKEDVSSKHQCLLLRHVCFSIKISVKFWDLQYGVLATFLCSLHQTPPVGCSFDILHQLLLFPPS